MASYGSDKPDLRFGLRIGDLTDIAGASDFGIFRSVVKDGGVVRGILAPGCAHYTRSQLDELARQAQGFGAGGLVTIALDSQAASLATLTMAQVKSAVAKFLTIEQIREMARRLEAGPGDLLLIVAGKTLVAAKALGELRRVVGERLNLVDQNRLAFAFVIDFPLLAWNDKLGRWEAEHHPFTSPRPEDFPLLDKEPERARGRHYDIVCNGYEAGGGSIRIHNSDLQRRIFRLMGYKDEEIDGLFGHMLEAFSYGAPPHGGIAIGIDRLVMILAGEKTIREVIAFPKTQEALDLTFNAPSPVTGEQLKELHIDLREEA
jgi:aspartyl-tRNA synthetase